jgi:hypothetical protein
LDHFVKSTLSVRHYVRYVNDIVLLHENAEQLRIWETKIRKFLSERLLLQAHENTIVAPVGLRGVDFVGYVIRPDYMLPRRRILRQAEQRITQLETSLEPSYLRDYERWPVESNAIEHLRATWASYYGHFAHASFHRALKRLWERHPISRFHLFSPIPTKPRFASFKIDSCWSDQITRLREGLEKTVLILKVGRYAEVPYERDRVRLGLQSFKHRKGLRSRAGVRYSQLHLLLERALKKGFPAALDAESFLLRWHLL